MGTGDIRCREEGGTHTMSFSRQITVPVLYLSNSGSEV